MKTLKGKVTSTSPTTLSEAAGVLSNFISNDPDAAAAAAATQAVSAYLRRSTAAFDDLVELHKDLGDLDKVQRIPDGASQSKKRRKREDEEEESHGGEITSPKKQKKRRRIQPEQL